MQKLLVALAVLLATCALHAAPPPAGPDANWKADVAAELPLLGHRNWILIVDSAYPLEVSPGIETIDTSAPQLAVAHFVLAAVGNSLHVSPDIYMDAELPFVSDQDAPDVSAYRRQVGDLLQGYQVISEPHAQLLSTIAQDGQTFKVLVLKTNSTIPYSSIFIRLDCKYWPAAAEQRLRARMAGQSGNQ